uniref:VQ domain-containing protein n=1 Tax=Kalanchoe fedtschenkoi TaxID=63787 RepID=A0A7N0TK72_KALFE
MANSPKPLDMKTPSFLHSPNPQSCISPGNGGLQSVTRSDPNNPYPTTFVQADTTSFKQVVQMLTGSSETAKHASTHKPNTSTAAASGQSEFSRSHNHQIPPMKPKQSFKLYERRNSMKNFKISPLIPGFAPSGFSPRKQEILSPSMLDFPSLTLSPVTPLIPDPFTRSPFYHSSSGSVSGSCLSGAEIDSRAEERAIAEKGFYLHKSPATTPRESEPRLLPLFPVTSPKLSGPSVS